MRKIRGLLLLILIVAAGPPARAGVRDDRAAATLGALGAQIRRDSAGQITAISLFPGASKVTDEDLACIDGLPALKSVLLIETHLTDAALAHLVNLPALETLYLGGTHTDAKGITRTGGLGFTNAGLLQFGKIKTLRRLVLASPRFGDTGIDAVTGLSELRSLGLSSPGFTDACLAKIVRLATLEELVLDGSSIKGPGLAGLAALPKLRSLVLGSNEFSGTEVEHVAGLASLRRLMFYRAKLADDVPSLLGRLTRLETLDLVETPLAAGQLSALKKALPSTQIQYDEVEQLRALGRGK
jgi:hypothetical protein